MDDIIKTLQEHGVFDLKNASAKISFDDLGIVQEIIIEQRRRKAAGEDLYLKGLPNGVASADYFAGVLTQVRYETKWRRPRIAPEPK